MKTIKFELDIFTINNNKNSTKDNNGILVSLLWPKTPFTCDILIWKMWNLQTRVKICVELRTSFPQLKIYI